MLKDKRILIGVTGGVAIYKVLDLISRLKKKGAVLDVIMTKAATEMISPILFQTMARCKVHVEMFEESSDYDVEHIALAEACDLVLVAPATANTIAKVAHGIADNLLTTTLLACVKPIIFATAMNTNMLNNFATQKNICDLINRGYYFIESETGFLACNTYGNGRMAEPVQIIDYLESFVTPKDLNGKKIIVTAGPTVERIDPVRYISNDSSGKMGYAIARAAHNRGAEVTLISGPTNLEKISGIKSIDIESAEDLFNAINDVFLENEVLIMAAAPADFKVDNQAHKKIKSSSIPEIQLSKNKDIISHFASIKDDRLIIGFAAETNDLIENASLKLKRKNLDYIIANDVSKPGAGFNVDTNIASIISKEKVVNLPLMSKFELADEILNLI